MSNGSCFSRIAVLAFGISVVGCSRAHASGHDASDGGGHDPSMSAHEPAAHTAPHDRPKESKTDSHAAPAGETHRPAHGDDGDHRDHRRVKFVVPFTWETSEDEPLARMRGFMRSALADNHRYATANKPEFFAAFAKGQKPRATVVTCSDSRVQSTAFDATPENDVFTIRNIGNQMLTAEGSVEYGVHHLKTPVVMVLGHTGCGAVKAAMGDYGKESPAIVRELSSLRLPKAAPGASETQALTAGVVANVHAQVGLAVLKFGEEVERGDVTIVGAVYDFRDDMGKGPGRVTIVNVNGHSAPEKVDAFTRAMASEGERSKSHRTK